MGKTSQLSAALLAGLILPGLPNAAHVDGPIYRGGRPRIEEGGFLSLQSLGIKKVIDLQGGDLTARSKAHLPDWPKVIGRLEPGETRAMIEKEIGAGADAGIEVVSVALDSLDPVDDADAQAIDGVLKELCSADPKRPIYVHCEHGKDRTGMVIGLFRMRCGHWSQADASREMKEMGHTGFLDEHFTGNMDLPHVLALHPELAAQRRD